MLYLDRIRANVANTSNNAQQQAPPGTASNNFDKTLASTGGRRKYAGQPIGRGGWPNQDPLHDPPVSIDSFLQPVVGADKQHSGAKTTFHTH